MTKTVVIVLLSIALLMLAGGLVAGFSQRKPKIDHAA